MKNQCYFYNRYLIHLFTFFILNSSDGSSDSDSDVLLAAEDEAKECCITRKHVELFDRIKKRRRIIDRVESSDDESIDTSDITNEYFTEMFRAHMKRKKTRRKIRNQPPEQDKPPKPKSSKKEKPSKLNAKEQKRLNRSVSSTPRTRSPDGSQSLDEPNYFGRHPLILDDSSFQGPPSSSASSPRHPSSKQKHSKSGKKKGEKSKGEKKPPSIEQLNARRRKLWVAIVKKEIGKAHKARNVAQKEKIVNSKKLALQCMKVVRQKVVASQRSAKEAQAKAKRLTKEMLAHWRQVDRIEKAAKKQQEQEAEKQQKIDLQILEAKRQQRKLNFLITQTELYSHFMANKIDSKEGNKNEAAEKGKSILEKLDEEKPSGRLAELDTYQSDAAKRQAMTNASKAVRAHIQQTKVFDAQISQFLEDEPVDIVANDSENTKTGAALLESEQTETQPSSEREQPNLFHGTLKKYQLKGMNWLLDLYDQGINGILADEMGLGKTVQSIAMLGHIAEKYNIWGPFLVISPASTLHNWQQEIARFLPEFKIVPYWGSPQGKICFS